MPLNIPVGMVVAVRPDNNSTDQYWLATVTEVCQTTPIKYNLRYYQFNKSKKHWILMKGKQAYVVVKLAGILFAGVEFNQNMTISAASMKCIHEKISIE